MRVFCPAKTTIEHKATFNFLYCKSANGNFTVQFKDGEKIPFNVNCYKKRLETTQSFYIINENDFELDIEMIVGFGDYGDNSTTIAQDVHVINSETEQFKVVCAPADGAVFIASSKKYKIEATPFEAEINSDGMLTVSQLTGCSFCRIQNISGNDMRLYSPNGYILAPLGVEELSLSDNFNIYGTAGDKVVIGGFK